MGIGVVTEKVIDEAMDYQHTTAFIRGWTL